MVWNKRTRMRKTNTFKINIIFVDKNCVKIGPWLAANIKFNVLCIKLMNHVSKLFHS